MAHEGGSICEVDPNEQSQPAQMVFLGQLTMVETAKLTERLARYVMLKLVFIGAVTTPTMAELVMWFTWCDACACCRVVRV